MTTSTSLYELILNLLRDPNALQDFQNDPDAYLASCGNFSSADVKDALELARDNDDDDDDSSNGRDHHSVHVAPPSNPPRPEPGESEHEAAVRYLNTYVTNNYVDDRDTTVDNSTNQQIDTHGGDFDQDIDVHSNVASGDGAVAAGGDIDGSTVTTGDHNVVGDDNITGDDNVTGAANQVVSGDDNTTSFGEGDANSVTAGDDLKVGDGAGFATGGDVAVDNTDTSVHDSNNDTSDNSTDNADNSALDTSLHNTGNDQHETHIDDSLQDNSDSSDHSDDSTESSLDVHVHG